MQLDYLRTHTSLSPIRRGFAHGFVNYKKGCTRLTTASDKVYQLLAPGRWFYPDTPASSTTKTGRHDIAEILLKMALSTKNQSINQTRRKLVPQIAMLFAHDKNFATFPDQQSFLKISRYLFCVVLLKRDRTKPCTSSHINTNY